MTYLGYTVWNTKPERDPDLQRGIRNNYVLVGRETQTQTKFSLVMSEEEMLFKYLQRTAPDRTAIKSFFDTNKGRYGLFWVPSWKTDFILTRTLTLLAGQFYSQVAYRENSLRLYTKHIYYDDPTSPWAAKISSISNTDGEDVVAFSPGAGTQVNIGQTIMLLYLCRLDMDALQIQIIPGGSWTETTLQFRELQKETP